MRTRLAIAVAAVVSLTHAAANAAAPAEKWGLKTGDVQLKSAGPLAFGLDGIVFVGDIKAATIYAIDTDSAKGDASKVTHAADKLNEKLNAAFGIELNGLAAKGVAINDLAVNPISGQIVLSVSVGGRPALVRIDEKGELSEIKLKGVPHAKVMLKDAPEDKEVDTKRGKANKRDEAITDIVYINGRVLVAGLSTAKSPSSVRELAFPFDEGEEGTSLEIYHAAHGKVEDYAVVRTFIPMNIGGETNVLAGFTCTPLVRFPLTGISKAAPGDKVRGTTVAELGNRNKPLDMIAYEKDGKTFLLMANSARGVMKISTEGITKNPGLTEPVTGGGVAGQTYETIKELEGTVQLDKLNETSAVVVISAGGTLNLKTVALP